jgi:hypothetical protein
MSFDLIITVITAVEIEKFTPTDHQQPTGIGDFDYSQMELPFLKTNISFIPQDIRLKKVNNKPDMCSKEELKKMFL